MEMLEGKSGKEIMKVEGEIKPYKPEQKAKVIEMSGQVGDN